MPNEYIDYAEIARMNDYQLAEKFKVRDWYVYNLSFSALAATTSASDSFTVQSDANFLCTELMVFADIAGAVQTDSSRVIPLVTGQILVSSSGSVLSSTAVPLGSISGTGALPYMLPCARLFVANSQVTLTVANFSAATTYNLRIAFGGVKLTRYF